MASPHHGQSVAEPLCLHPCNNYYLILATLPAGTTLIRQGHIRAQDTPISKGVWAFSFLLTDCAIGKGDRTNWLSPLLGSFCCPAAVYCAKRCCQSPNKDDTEVRRRQNLLIARVSHFTEQHHVSTVS